MITFKFCELYKMKTSWESGKSILKIAKDFSVDPSVIKNRLEINFKIYFKK